MSKNRLEAFSDGVIAIIITIMVLEMKVPHGDSLAAIKPLIPVFISYVLSFIYVGIYWNNHHHLLLAAKTVNGAILWANLHLLFWLSLIPFVTGWLGESHFTKWPAVFYGFVLLMCAIAYAILTKLIVRHHGKGAILAIAIGKDTKGKISIIIYLIAMLSSYYSTYISLSLYVLVAIVWLIPDKRIEKQLIEHSKQNPD